MFIATIIHVISFKRTSGRFSFHFREVYQKCIEYIGKFLIQMRKIWNFAKKWYVLEEILGLIVGSLPEDQGRFTCMHNIHGNIQLKTLVNTVYRTANGILNKIYKVPQLKPRVFWNSNFHGIIYKLRNVTYNFIWIRWHKVFKFM